MRVSEARPARTTARSRRITTSIGMRSTDMGQPNAGPVQSKGMCLLDLPAQLHCKAERVHLVVHGLAPGHDLAGAYLGSGSVMQLHPRAGRGRRSGQRLGECPDLTGNLHPPPSEILGHFELDRYELEAADLANELRKNPIQPPAWPEKTFCSASRCASSARSSMKMPSVTGFSLAQAFPSNIEMAITLSPFSLTSPYAPSRT